MDVLAPPPPAGKLAVNLVGIGGSLANYIGEEVINETAMASGASETAPEIKCGITKHAQTLTVDPVRKPWCYHPVPKHFVYLDLMYPIYR